MEAAIEDRAEKQVEIEKWGKYEGTSEQVGIKNSFIAGFNLALQFSKWCIDNYYIDSEGFYHNDYQNKIWFTTEQLFELYNKENV